LGLLNLQRNMLLKANKQIMSGTRKQRAPLIGA
jgi:hypothetical protein